MDIVRKVREKLDVHVKFLQRNATGLVIALLLTANVIFLAHWLGAAKETAGEERQRSERSGYSGRDPQHHDSSDFSSGAVFTRWGRTVCPAENKLVYAGVVGGAHYTHSGSGSNYLCMPLDPIYENTIVGVQNPAIIYGAEYETGANSLGAFSGANTEGGALHDHNVPCAVCRSSRHSTALMIPARTQCYDGWSNEYHGYLVATHHTHKSKSTFVCMDHEPEADRAGYRNEDGALFYHVESACGSLPCPPYANGKELTCVVCTK